MFFWRSSLSHPFFRVGSFFNGSVAVMHFFRGCYMEEIIFGSSYLLRTATFLKGLSYAYDFLREVYLFHHPNCSHLSFEATVFITERMVVIHSLKGTVFIVTAELEVIICLCNSFSSRMFIF